MDEPNPARHLSDISTVWNIVAQAHADASAQAHPARCLLLERYGPAVRHYLVGAVRDPEAADDLFQEFGLRLARGAFRGVAPERGRFRDFLKTTLIHLVNDYRRRQRQRPLPLPTDILERLTLAAGPDPEAEGAALRQEVLLRRTWLALQRLEQRTGQPCFTVLRLRTEHPGLSSADLAKQLGSRLGKPFTIQGLRQTLHRARDHFADVLLDEVRQSLGQVSRSMLEEELQDLGWLGYCRAALERSQRLAGRGKGPRRPRGRARLPNSGGNLGDAEDVSLFPGAISGRLRWGPGRA